MTLKRTRNLIFLAALLTGPMLAVAQIQDVGNGGIRVFEPTYFMEFDPLNAGDMVENIPGVTPQQSDGGRGLSGVRSNLLINGERPPPKGKSARQQLNEMPVGSVILIELIDAGARLDLDMQGYDQVINVITDENRPAYYELTTEMQHSGTGDNDQENERQSQMDGTGTFFKGDHQFTVTGNWTDRSNRSPSGFVDIDPANPTQRVSSLNTFDRQDQGIQFDAVLALPNDSVLSLNTEYSEGERGSAPLSLGLDADLDAVDESFDRMEDLHDFSAEYRRPIASNGELMVAFVDTTQNEQSASYFSSPDLTRESTNISETGETATRFFLTNTPTQRLTIRTNVSNAFNYFDGGFRIFEDGQEIIIDGSNSRVQEDRRSLDSSVDWNFTPKWTFRGTVGMEAYEITTRDVESHGTQTDPKGELSISFRPQPRTTFTLSTARSVGQLSFNQFLASSSLSSEIITAGAAELEPERQKTMSATYDRRFGDRGVMRFGLTRTEVENPVRSVALSETLIVSQNTTPKVIDQLQVSFDFPFTRWGQEDLILSVSGNFFDSETIDPITGELREVSMGGSFGGGFSGGGGNWSGGGGFGSFAPRYYKQLELRKDPGDGKWSWSMSVQDVQPTGTYSVRSIRNQDNNYQWNGSLTFEPIQGLRIRGNIDGPRAYINETLFYSAVRAIGLDPSFVSESASYRGRFLSLTVEWRRERFEITGSISSRPENRSEEGLRAWGDAFGTFLTTEVARTPRAMLRFRFKS